MLDKVPPTFCPAGHIFRCRVIQDNNETEKAIQSKLSTGENCYLTVADGADTNGANIEISSFRGDDSQKFRLNANPGGSVMLMTKCSKESKCVEIVDAETGAGANVQQWVPTGSTCQWWTFEMV